MKSAGCIPVLTLVLLCCLAAAEAPAAGGGQPELREEDCVKCHWFQMKTRRESGGKHATEVGCLDCHPRHPPEEENTITACGACHGEQPHYIIGGCLECHADPHRPLVTLRDPAKPARDSCLSCHAEVGWRMGTAVGSHEKLFCTRCHDRHGFIPDCLDCHSVHLAGQQEADCRQCHPAHRPLEIVPAGWVPAAYCQVCHQEEGRDLAATTSLHGGVNCVYCHKGQHPSTPSCQECHGLPHGQILHSKFRRCLQDCHGDAHALLSDS